MRFATRGDDEGSSGSGADGGVSSSSPAEDQVVLALDDFAALHALTLGVEAWADVYDERRYRSLVRTGEADGHGPGYPQRTFDDHAAALAWVRTVLDG
ncbi:hypothetical protein ACI8AF_17010 [Blastococcus sp. SYSU D00669]